VRDAACPVSTGAGADLSLSIWNSGLEKSPVKRSSSSSLDSAAAWGDANRSTGQSIKETINQGTNESGSVLRAEPLSQRDAAEYEHAGPACRTYLLALRGAGLGDRSTLRVLGHLLAALADFLRQVAVYLRK
jgi:hypothetical protein